METPQRTIFPGCRKTPGLSSKADRRTPRPQMHARPKETAEQRARRHAEEQPKAEALRAARDAVLSADESNTSNEKLLELTSSLCEANPDAYTAFNMRRSIFLQQEPSSLDMPSELSFSLRTLHRQPKAYPAWLHRRWLLHHAHMNSHYCEQPDFQNELSLCSKLLSRDMRNMHCWAYRRFVCSLSGRSLESELQWVLQRIHDHLGNYSAWHYRSQLVKQLHCKHCCDQPAYTCTEAAHPGVKLSPSALSAEFDLINEGIFTDPSDQSPWLYHRTMEELADASNPETIAVLEAQAGRVRELLKLEPESKWTMLTLARLLERIYGSCDEAVELYEKLKQVDPARRGYFDDMQKRLREGQGSRRAT